MCMHTIDAFEAKTHFSSLLDNVEKGEQIIITKHGKAVAKLSPVTTRKNKAKIIEAIQRIKEFQKHNRLEMEWKELHDEIRK